MDGDNKTEVLVTNLNAITTDKEIIYIFERETETSVEQSKQFAVIDDYTLYQNYPNPFNPETKIKFDLPESVKVKIELYNILGQYVVTLLNTRKSAGSYEINLDASQLTSGMYFYTIQTDNFSKVKKMLLVK